MSTHNICFSGEIKKKYLPYTSLIFTYGGVCFVITCSSSIVHMVPREGCAL